MLLMPTQISHYQEMSALSARMVDAARAQDWETLIGLEQAVAALRDSLSKDSDNDLSEADQELKSRLIQKILEVDFDVRRHTAPWMEDVRQFLGATAQRRRVENAYNAGAGSAE